VSQEIRSRARADGERRGSSKPLFAEREDFVATPKGSNAHRPPTATAARLCAAALLLGAGGAWAQEQDAGPDEEWEDESYAYETVVRDYRLRPTDETTAFAETIDVGAQSASPASVADVVGEAVGVQVRQLGGLGSFGAASIRGSTPGQVQVYLDGIPLNAGGFPTVDLGDLGLDTLETIEVYRGGGPLELGAPGIGGVIALNTREVDRPLSEVALTAGSWTTLRALALHGNRVGDLTALGILTAQGSRGDFEYLNRNGTLFEDDDDRIQRRTNNEHASYGTLFKLDGPLGGWRWTAANDLNLTHRGVPGIDSVPTTSSELETLREAVSLRVGGPLGAPSARLSLSGSYLALREDFSDPADEIGLGAQRTLSRSDGAGLAGVLDLDWDEDNATALRLAGRYERFAFEELVAGTAPEPSTRLALELGAEHEWRVVEPLRLVPALRLAVHRSRFGGGTYAGYVTAAPAADDTSFFWSPSLGARYEIVRGLTLRANAGRYYRAPDLSELYGDRGAVIGNPRLEAEVGYDADAGVTWIRAEGETLTLLRLEAAWFGAWSEDLIVYVQNSQNTIRPENADGARILGAEASAALELIDLVSFQANYTYLNAINVSSRPYHDGRFLPGRPAHEAYGKVEVGQSRGEWGAALWLDVDYAGESYLDQANLKRDSLARLLFGLGYRLERPREGLSLTLEVRNLFDTYVIEDASGDRHPLRDYEGFPLPGRTVFVTLQWKA